MRSKEFFKSDAVDKTSVPVPYDPAAVRKAAKFSEFVYADNEIVPHFFYCMILLFD